MGAKKVAMLIEGIKGDKTYPELRADVERVTGVRIGLSSFQKYIYGTRFPTYDTLIALESYAKKIDARVPSIEDIIETMQDESISSLRRLHAPKIVPMDGEIEIYQIPIVGSVPAGGPVLVDENLIGHVPIPSLFLKDSRDIFCLKVNGNSMIDLDIEDGDYVLVQQQSTAENGQTVIARINGEVTVKRFYLMKDTVKLEPANKKFKAISSRDVEIVGVVIKVIKDIF